MMKVEPRYIAASMLTLLSSTPLFAGSGTITVLDSTNTTRTYDVVTDGSGNFVSKMVICDQSAAANCAGVDSSNRLSVLANQPTAANLNATVIGAGAAGTANAGVVTVQGITSMTPLGASVTNANTNGQAAMASSSPVAIASNQTLPWTGSTGATAPTSASLDGFFAINAEITPVANGTMTPAVVGLEGKLINLPYANKENMVRGSASATGTSLTPIIASAGVGLKNYITSVECGRSDGGTLSSIVTFNDSSSIVMVIPNNGGGGGNNMVFPTPVATAAATAFSFTPGGSLSTLYCSAQGYKGT